MRDNHGSSCLCGMMFSVPENHVLCAVFIRQKCCVLLQLLYRHVSDRNIVYCYNASIGTPQSSLLCATGTPHQGNDSRLEEDS